MPYLDILYSQKLQYVISGIMLMKEERGYSGRVGGPQKTEYFQCIYEQIASSSASFLQMALKRAQRKPMIYLEGPGVFCPVAEGSYAPLL